MSLERLVLAWPEGREPYMRPDPHGAYLHLRDDTLREIVGAAEKAAMYADELSRFYDDMGDDRSYGHYKREAGRIRKLLDEFNKASR